MKKPIIEIEELGEPNSLIYRKDAKISEIVNTKKLIKELNEQLRLHFVLGQSEQLPCEHPENKIWYNDKSNMQCNECGEEL